MQRCCLLPAKRSLRVGENGTNGTHGLRAEKVSTIVRGSKGTLDKSMPEPKRMHGQVFRDGGEAKTSFFVYFGRDHSMPDYIGKGVIDTGCSRFLIGQNTLEKWEHTLTRRWGLSTQRIQLARPWHSVLATMRHWRLYSLLELQESMEYCVCTWYLVERRSCSRKNF